jgi:hypothetical protein
MGKLDCFKAKALALARSGYFYRLPPLEFELSFEEGFSEAREWLTNPRLKKNWNVFAKSLARSIRPHNRQFAAVQIIAKLPSRFVSALACINCKICGLIAVQILAEDET